MIYLDTKFRGFISLNCPGKGRTFGNESPFRKRLERRLDLNHITVTFSTACRVNLVPRYQGIPGLLSVRKSPLTLYSVSSAMYYDAFLEEFASLKAQYVRSSVL